MSQIWMRKTSCKIVLLIFPLILAACSSSTELTLTLSVPVDVVTAVEEKDLQAENTPESPFSDENETAMPEQAIVESDSSIQSEAMRPNFVSDVDAFSGGITYWMEVEIVNIYPFQINGRQRVRYLNTSEDRLDEIVFRLYPNGLAGEELLVVDQVRSGEQLLETSLSVQDSVLRIALDTPLSPGEEMMLDMAYTFTLQESVEVGYGRIAHRSDVISAPHFFPTLAVYQDGAWNDAAFDGPGDPAYSETGLFDVRLTASSELKIATSGTTISTVEHDDGRTSYYIVTGPMRDFALAASPNFRLFSQTQDDLTVNIWTASTDQDAVEFAMESTFESIRVFDETFGIYPYNELDIVIAPVSALGIEYPGLIYLASRIWGDDEYFGLLEWVIVHEVAHQWWYGLVGDDQIAEPWLDEGLAEHSVEIYYRDVQPGFAPAVRERYQEELDNYLASGEERMPVGLPAGAYHGGEYRVFVYSVGALFYNYLEDAFGERAVNTFLNELYKRYHYEVISNDAYVILLEEILGQSATDLFNEWIISDG